MLNHLINVLIIVGGLFNNNVLIDIGIPLFSGLIILFVLIMECRAHSHNYFQIYRIFDKEFWREIKRECNIKVTPILVFSLFLSLLIGMMIQLAAYKSLLDTENKLPQVTFSSNFTKIEHHKNNIQLLINDLESYKSEIIVTSTHKLPFDTLLRYNREKHIQTFFTEGSIIKKMYHANMDSIFQAKDLISQINHIDALLPELHSRIIDLHHFTATYNNTDSLLKIITKTCLLKDENYKIYSQFLRSDIKNKRGHIAVFSWKPWINKDDVEQAYLFPKLLVIHAFIALLIAFIVNMIVSGKTVTEGL